MRNVVLGTVAAMAIAVGGSAVKAADLVDTVLTEGSFTTLVAGLQRAELVDTLRGEGPFTVFAPNDDAFLALPEGTVDMLLDPVNRDQLQAVLTYHVVPGVVMSEAAAGTVVELETVHGQMLTVDGTGDAVTVNGATVITADVEAANGIIHVIDAVLMPD
ncbi:MAG: fasciclin domain-containing protein [Geminicoccaceae bacterium]|nr:MAG: fasciclin domain-containing protein [Geminicoccaceae bacterium]